jgi:ribonuclease inhibitor
VREFIIDGRMMTSKNAVYTHLDRIFSFPSHFGNNLDALWDVLTEENEATIIHFKHTEVLTKHLEDYGKKLLKVFKNLEQKKANYTIYFYPEE